MKEQINRQFLTKKQQNDTCALRDQNHIHRGSPAVMMGPNEDPYIYRLLFDDDYNVAQQKQLNKIIRRMRKDIEFFRNESIEIDKYQRVKLSTL